MLMRKIRENIKNKLEKLAEENRKQFHGGRLDCCTVNRTPAVKRGNSAGKKKSLMPVNADEQGG